MLSLDTRIEDYAEGDKHAIVPFDGEIVMENGEIIENHGLIGCIAIAGFFRNADDNVAFMTHQGVQDVVKNLTRVANIADRHKLRELQGTLFIFRQNESLMPSCDYLIHRELLQYNGVVELIKRGLSAIFKKCHIIEVRYGNRGRGDTGSARLDLKEKKFTTDIEEDNF